MTHFVSLDCLHKHRGSTGLTIVANVAIATGKGGSSHYD